jgi:hypothetical protein
MRTFQKLCALGGLIGLMLTASAVSAFGQSSPLTNSVVGNNLSFFTINGQPNPTLTLQRGVTYVFQVNGSIHPFYIKTNRTGLSADQFTDGVTGNGTTIGTITFAVPASAPDLLHYQCGNHASMGGDLNIIDPPAPPTVKIVYFSLSQSTVTIQSTGAADWTPVPEYSSNLTSAAWSAVPDFTNTFSNGTNTTTFDRLDAICGQNVFLRVRNAKN